MYGHLIALDNCLGIFPVEVSEAWRRLFAKCVLWITKPKATNKYQDDHIYAGLKVVIDRAIHRVQDIWDANLSTVYWGFLRVYLNNLFKNSNRIIILWMVSIHGCLETVLFLTFIITGHH